MQNGSRSTLLLAQINWTKQQVSENTEFIWGCARDKQRNSFAKLLFRTANLQDPLEKQAHTILLEGGKDLARLMSERSLEEDPERARKASSRLAIIREVYGFV